MTGRINDSICDKIHRYIHKNGKVLVKSICVEFGLSAGAVHNHINSLKAKGRVKPLGIMRCPKSGRILAKKYESIKEPPPEPVIKIKESTRKRMIAPETKYKTVWRGGSHPCSVVNPWARVAA